MTLLYILFIGLGGTLVLSGVYNTPYVLTIQSILQNKPLTIGQREGQNQSNNNPAPPGPAGVPQFPQPIIHTNQNPNLPGF